MNLHLFKNQECLIEDVFYNFMKEKGYSVHLYDELDIKDFGYGGYALKNDKFACIFELHSWSDPKSFNIFVEDRNGNSVIMGETAAIYSLSLSSELSDDDLKEKFELLLYDVYEKYSEYSRENRLEFSYNNLQMERKEYFDIEQNKDSEMEM